MRFGKAGEVEKAEFPAQKQAHLGLGWRIEGAQPRRLSALAAARRHALQRQDGRAVGPELCPQAGRDGSRHRNALPEGASNDDARSAPPASSVSPPPSPRSAWMAVSCFEKRPVLRGRPPRLNRASACIAVAAKIICVRPCSCDQAPASAGTGNSRQAAAHAPPCHPRLQRRRRTRLSTIDPSGSRLKCWRAPAPTAVLKVAIWMTKAPSRQLPRIRGSAGFRRRR